VFISKKLLKVNSSVHGIEKEKYSQEVYFRLKKIRQYKALKQDHCSDNVVFKILEVPRSTLLRWQKLYQELGPSGLANQSRAPNKIPKIKYSKELVKLVLKIRKENPTWGKGKINAILKREYDMKSSVSTVGRIINMLIQKKHVHPVRYYFGRIKEKKRRVFNKHAKRWKYGMKPSRPGQMIQIDHAVVEATPERYVKQFDATCPITKLTVSQVYQQASSRTAANFLAYIQEQFPFKIDSIQVDGGSEFMGEFEQLCQEKGIGLLVLPPRSPKFNGNVERRHATIKYEFFSTYDGPPDLAHIRVELAKFIDRYNRYRPHQSLNYDTPWHFYLKLEA